MLGAEAESDGWAVSDGRGDGESVPPGELVDEGDPDGAVAPPVEAGGATFGGGELQAVRPIVPATSIAATCAEVRRIFIRQSPALVTAK